jgi:translation elongation factor EF-Ts
MEQPLIGIYVHHDRQKAAIVCLSLQTDFAARTYEAITVANKLAMYAVGFDTENITELLKQGGEEILNDLRKELKENISLRYIKLVDGTKL